MALITLDNVRTPPTPGFQLEIPEWELHQGQKWVVLGSNGAGKTTFANVLTGQQAIARGERKLADGFLTSRDIAMVSFERQQAMYALDNRFDDSELREDANDRGTTVESLLNASTVDDQEHQHWIDTLDIRKLLHSGIRNLSTGEMRKVLIAQALLGHATVLVLDNPLSGLDIKAQSEFSQLLDHLFKHVDTVLLLLSQPSQIPQAATDVLVLDKGRVALEGRLNSIGPSAIEEALAQSSAACREELLPAPLPDNQLQALEPTTPLVEMHNVSVSFGDKTVFTGLNWTWNFGQHVMVVGPNGCGKSTLLSMLNGDNAKAYGQDIHLFGKKKGSGESVWELKKHFGLVSTALHTQYTRGHVVLDVVLSGFHDSIGLYDDSGDAQRQVARQWLGLIGLSGLEKTRYKGLSYGQQRLVLFARAMVKQPHILILDEPCIGLDDPNRRNVLRLINTIAAHSRTHIIYVSHVLDERPSCISQLLSFEPVLDGFTVSVCDVSAIG